MITVKPLHKSGGFMQWWCSTVCLFVCSFVCCQRVLVGHWLTDRAVHLCLQLLTATVLLGHMDQGCLRCFFSVITYPPPRVIYANDRGLLMSPIWLLHVFSFKSVCVCVRCGDIFDAAFVARMSSFAQRADLSEQTQTLLTVIRGEAELGCLEVAKVQGLAHSEQQSPDDSVEDTPAAKRLCLSSSSQMSNDTVKPCAQFISDSAQDTAATKCCSSSSFQSKDAEASVPVACTPYSRGPMFYYCLHRRHLKHVNLPK